MPNLKNNRPAIFIDVDNTLIIWSAKHGKPKATLNKHLTAKLREQADADVVLWSRRGKRYAEAMAERFKVTDLFDAIVGKPTTIFDDEGLEWLKGVRVITR